MRSYWSLCRQHLRHYRLTTAIWLFIISMMAYAVAAMAPSVVEGNSLQVILKSFGSVFQRLFGDVNAYRYPVDLFIQGKWLQFMPLLAGIFGAISAMGIMARDIDHRTADFVLTLPVRRAKVLLARFAALAFNVGLLYAGSVTMLWLGLRQAGLAGAYDGYVFFSLGHYFLTLFFAALTLFLSLVWEEYSLANRYALLGVIGLYTLYLILKGVGAPHWSTWFSLSGLVDAEQVVGRGHFPWAAVLVGGLLTAISLWGSTASMDKKQIPA